MSKSPVAALPSNENGPDDLRCSVRLLAPTGAVGLIIVTFAYNAVIARLISPHHFGLVAMAMVVGGFLQVFKDAGLSTATIQRSTAWIARLCGWRVAKQAQF